MKTLPDSPSLDHLRRQAKDLLPHLRGTRPDASLSDAQAAVAEQYGFHRWTDLKAEVDRRNAITPVAADGMAEAVAAAFGLGTPVAPMTAVERGWAGQTWSLTTDAGRFLVHDLYDFADSEALEVDVRLAEAAIAAGVIAPRPVRSTGGRVVAEIDGSRWRAHEWMALGPEPQTPADPKLAHAAGRIIATIHSLRLPSAGPVTPWLWSRRTEETWWALHDASKQASASWTDALADAIPEIMRITAIVDDRDRDEAAVLSTCHFAPNAFRVAGDDLALPHFEHAGGIPPLWDVGGALVNWSKGVDGSVRGDVARAVLAGYRSVAPIPGPLDLRIFNGDISAHLNWLATRIQIALGGDDAEGRREAARNVEQILTSDPLHKDRLERILDAVG